MTSMTSSTKMWRQPRGVVLSAVKGQVDQFGTFRNTRHVTAEKREIPAKGVLTS